ncbi:MAG: uncharacterized protein KVP18_000121 [Porospora cf. gigantea A]|uniref:uncharacterized protein n=1 Tax=Porospora cf. gigantea A TaxID=2853593 RepID=UPI00355A3C5A|nr:MAG: hypothetical protein KVP18_000121 [Porospora cf. gigantea A]
MRIVTASLIFSVALAGFFDDGAAASKPAKAAGKCSDSHALAELSQSLVASFPELVRREHPYARWFGSVLMRVPQERVPGMLDCYFKGDKEETNGGEAFGASWLQAFDFFATGGSDGDGSALKAAVYNVILERKALAGSFCERLVGEGYLVETTRSFNVTQKAQAEMDQLTPNINQCNLKFVRERYLKELSRGQRYQPPYNGLTPQDVVEYIHNPSLGRQREFQEKIRVRHSQQALEKYLRTFLSKLVFKEVQQAAGDSLSKTVAGNRMLFQKSVL